MIKAILQKGKITYRFEQDGLEYWVIGEEEKYRGMTKVIMSELVDKETGNKFYKSLIEKGYKEI